ncbi:putative large secreted protein [Lachnospiraceae bacterium KM106-2]|nr:putative large secreted protein [Lachnospiraceae bacterium KM106-2]
MNQLWYRKPAFDWCQALPLGNSHIGAMVFGGVFREHIQINEESIWSGTGNNRLNPDSGEAFPKIREYIKEGKIEEAEQLAVYALSGTPKSQSVYQAWGDIFMTDTCHKGVYSNYQRSLDLEQAVCNVTYQIGDTLYKRQMFISYPDQVFVMHLSAEGSKRLNFHVQTECKQPSIKAYKDGEDTIVLEKKADSGTKFVGMIYARTNGGSVHTVGEHLVIQDAKEVDILFTIATSYRFTNLYEDCKKILGHAKDRSYEELLQRHIADYQPLFQKVEITIGKESTLPTDERIKRVMAGKKDMNLLALYYQYGRYLMIAASRPGSLPMNRQGIWNDKTDPVWGSSYSLKIHTQMCYWPAEVANLSQCHIPLLDFIERLKKNGQVTARSMYGCNGFVAHTNSDVYADTVPDDCLVESSYWVMGGAWICLHIWQHYVFTKDLVFLKEHFDAIEQAVLFFKDYLVEREDHKLVTVPSVSQENTYIAKDGIEGSLCAGPVMDSQILHELFHAYVEANELLDADVKLREQVREMETKLPVEQIGAHGQIMQWSEDYEELEPGKRYIAQLFGVYPSARINVREKKELANAAIVTLDRRLQYGGSHTGWSHAWIAAMYARLQKGELALRQLYLNLQKHTSENLMNYRQTNRGTIFQIDGNLGSVAAFSEIFIQSYHSRVFILPALSETIQNGHMKGICLEGNAEAEISFEEGNLSFVTITAYSDYNAVLCYRNMEQKVELKKDESITIKFDK